GRFQQPELRPHLAPLQDAQRARHQRHGKAQIERHTLVRLALLMRLAFLTRLPLLIRWPLLMRRLLLLWLAFHWRLAFQRRLLLLLLRRRWLLLLLLAVVAGRTRPVVDDRFVSDELVAVLLQNGAGERASAHDEDSLVVLLQLVDQCDEIAI